MFNPFVKTSAVPHPDLSTFRTGRDLLYYLDNFLLAHSPLVYWRISVFFGVCNVVTFLGCVYFLLRFQIIPGKFWLFRLEECSSSVAATDDKPAEVRGTLAVGGGADQRSRWKGKHIVASALSTQLTFFALLLLVDTVKRILLYRERYLRINEPILSVVLEYVSYQVALNGFYWEMAGYAHLFLSHVRPLYWNVGVLAFPVLAFSTPIYFVHRACVNESRSQNLRIRITEAVQAFGVDKPVPLSVLPDLARAGPYAADLFYSVGLMTLTGTLWGCVAVLGFIAVTALVIYRVRQDLRIQRQRQTGWTSFSASAESDTHLAGGSAQRDLNAEPGRISRLSRRVKKRLYLGSDPENGWDDPAYQPPTLEDLTAIQSLKPDLMRFMIHCLVSACLGVSVPIVLSFSTLMESLKFYKYALQDPGKLTGLYEIYTYSYSGAIFLISTIGMANLYLAYRRPATMQPIDPSQPHYASADERDAKHPASNRWGRRRRRRREDRSGSDETAVNGDQAQGLDLCFVDAKTAISTVARDSTRSLRAAFASDKTLKGKHSVMTLGHDFDVDDGGGEVSAEKDEDAKSYSQSMHECLNATRPTVDIYGSESELMYQTKVERNRQTSDVQSVASNGDDTSKIGYPTSSLPSSTAPLRSAHQQLILDSLVMSRSLPIRDYFWNPNNVSRSHPGSSTSSPHAPSFSPSSPADTAAADRTTDATPPRKRSRLISTPSKVVGRSPLTALTSATRKVTTKASGNTTSDAPCPSSDSRTVPSRLAKPAQRQDVAHLCYTYPSSSSSRISASPDAIPLQTLSTAHGGCTVHPPSPSPQGSRSDSMSRPSPLSPHSPYDPRSHPTAPGEARFATPHGLIASPYRIPPPAVRGTG